MNLDDCEEVFHQIRESNQSEDLMAKFMRLFGDYEILNFALGPGGIYWRARKCDSANGFAKITDLAAPPAICCAAGRLNEPNQPVLYAATREVTALGEIGAKSGDYVHLVGFRILKERTLRLGFIGDYFHVYKTGQSKIGGSDPGRALTRVINEMGRDRALVKTYIDAFLSDVISDKRASINNYLHTRALIAVIFSKLPGLDGLFYPSVKDHVGMNVLVKNFACNEGMKIVCSNVVRVEKVREFGFFDYACCHQAVGVDDDGRLIMRAYDGSASHIFFSDTEGDLMEMRDRYIEMGHKSGEIVKHREVRKGGAMKMGEDS